MNWPDRVLIVAATAAVVLTILKLARTIQDVMSSQPAVSVRPPEEIGSSSDAPATARVWSDDVLAEEELEQRPHTRGAASHPFDVCTHWDEQDEREALQEAILRSRRSRRSQ